VSCGEDLYIDGQVEGTIDPKGNRLIIGPNGSVKANINARAVIVKGKLEGTIHARPGRLKAVGHCRGRHHDSAHLH
ncbi:MAG: polymer-forming cytoskeletal protein, partial [Candidatus Sulfotelmatobacter sp.]